ncbi:MAG TPA: hypothetical protein ENI33_04700 [Thermoplasmatales archaeon]|nr:hypothetical protein [Thermoplasmatales archaeon]
MFLGNLVRFLVTKEVAHGKQSVIFDEAENRLWAQMAILKWIFE